MIPPGIPLDILPDSFAGIHSGTPTSMLSSILARNSQAFPDAASTVIGHENRPGIA